MVAVTIAQGSVLDRVLDAACRISRGVLDRRSYGKFHEARMKTSWGSRHHRARTWGAASDDPSVAPGLSAFPDHNRVSGAFDGDDLDPPARGTDDGSVTIG
jgi:hypothetical protein